MCGVFILSEHRPTCISVVLIPVVKTVLPNFEYVKHSSLLNTPRGNCFDDEQYVYCTNSLGTTVRKPGLGLVVLVVLVYGVKNLVLFDHWLSYNHAGY